MAGPFCSMLLADLGADVIKVEPPGGEETRGMPPTLPPGISAAFLAVNRNKRGLLLDLKQPDGVGVLKKLAATADVLVENYRPGVARRLGVDYETLARSTPGSSTARSPASARPGPMPRAAATTSSPRA